jgi:hypothetical protein
MANAFSGFTVNVTDEIERGTEITDIYEFYLAFLVGCRNS